MKFEWKEIKTLDNDFTQRAKVIGGWIIRASTILAGSGFDAGDVPAISESMVFIPDPEHKWEITNE